MSVYDETELLHELSNIVSGAPLNLVYLKECESTNIECMKQAVHNTIVIADSQSAGRGRRGKKWHSPVAQNIYCSIGLNKTIKAEYLGLISLQVAVCIVNVLRQKGYTEAGLKWPNDILCQGKKLGGILIETKVLATDSFYLVIGFGLNVNLDDSDLQQIDQPAIGLNNMSDRIADRQELISAICSQILQDVMVFDLHLIDSLVNSFNQLDQLHGKQVLVKTVDEEISGIHLGILPTGHIQVQTSRGVESFAAAEISLRGL